MTLSRMLVLTMAIILFSRPGMTAEIALLKFSEDIPPRPSDFNDNFSLLRSAVLQTRTDLEVLQSDMRKQGETTTQIIQRLEAIESAVEQLRQLINDRGASVAPIISQSSKATETAAASTTAEYVSEVLKVQVVSAQTGPGIQLKLKFVNMTDKPIKLFAMEHRENTYLIDENSNQYPYKNSEVSDRGRRTELTPRGQRILAFEFSKPAGQAVGRRLELYCKIGYTEERRSNIQYLFVRIKNIAI